MWRGGTTGWATTLGSTRTPGGTTSPQRSEQLVEVWLQLYTP